jgi:hypothetical protein
MLPLVHIILDLTLTSSSFRLSISELRASNDSGNPIWPKELAAISLSS